MYNVARINVNFQSGQTGNFDVHPLSLARTMASVLSNVGRAQSF